VAAPNDFDSNAPADQPQRRRHGWSRVLVEGQSMAPALSPGEHLLVRWGAKVAVGDVVVAVRPDRPSLLVVKRAVRAEAGRWWLEGDNAEASDDSRVFGLVRSDEVVGRVVARIYPLPVRRL